MTLRKVAEKAGVAIDTVRKALRDDPTIRSYLKERVLKAAEEIDYHPNLVARALREKALQIVPISVNELQNPYFGSLALHLSQCLSEQGLEPALCLDAEHLLKLSRTLSPCGSILGYGYSDEAVRLLGKRQKVVSVGVEMKTIPGMGMVFIDFAEAYQSIAKTLKRMGRRSVAVHSITMADYVQRGETSRKFGAAINSLSESGLKLVRIDGRDFFTDLEVIPRFLAAHPRALDTVICENDQVATRLYGALMSRGIRVPEDVLIVGCDANLMMPGTLSIKIDTKAVAQEAVGLLLRLLDGVKNPAARVFKPVAVDESGMLETK
ncbi:MAG: LacI family DNA-binding transcriptional regulator [bacterium]